MYADDPCPGGYVVETYAGTQVNLHTGQGDPIIGWADYLSGYAEAYVVNNGMLYGWAFRRRWCDGGTSASDFINPLACGGNVACEFPLACEATEAFNWNSCQCEPVSPIIIDLLGNGFNLTDAAEGVYFDLNSDGRTERVSWTARDSDDAWLCLDRNDNGIIDSGKELFGNFTPQLVTPTPNGFIALAEIDKIANGGNGNGSIDRRDTVFSALRLWQDRDHNGVSESWELSGLLELGLSVLDLDYKDSRRLDQHGNWFRYRAKVKDTGGAHLGRWAWDVYLLAGRE
jgi:hypothetical protein